MRSQLIVMITLILFLATACTTQHQEPNSAKDCHQICQMNNQTFFREYVKNASLDKCFCRDDGSLYTYSPNGTIQE